MNRWQKATRGRQREARQKVVQPPDDSTDVRSVIRGVLDAEEDANETYRFLIDAAQEANDPVTEDFAVTILADEEHIERNSEDSKWNIEPTETGLRECEN